TELNKHKNLIFSPGIYHLDRSIEIKHANSVVFGLGFATLVPDRGGAAITISHAKAVKLAGLLIDAGPQNSPVLLQVGRHRRAAAATATMAMTAVTATMTPPLARSPLAATAPTNPPRCTTSFSASAGPRRARQASAWSSMTTMSSSTTSGPGAPTTATASAGPS